MPDTLVLLSGPGQLPEVWTGVVNELPHGVTPKLPATEGTLDQQLLQLHDYLQKRELTSFYLGGHGMGSMVAVKFAAANPLTVRGLVLSDPQLRVDRTQLKQARTGLRLVPKFLLRRRGADKDDLLRQLDDAASVHLGKDATGIADAGTPVSLLSSQQAAEASREFAEFLPQAPLEVVDVPAGTGPQPAWFEQKPEIFGAAVARLLV